MVVMLRMKRQYERGRGTQVLYAKYGISEDTIETPGFGAVVRRDEGHHSLFGLLVTTFQPSSSSCTSAPVPVPVPDVVPSSELV